MEELDLNSKEEEYEWGERWNKGFNDIPYDNMCDIMDNMTDEDAKRLGFTGGMDDLWDYMTSCYTIKEQ